MAGVQRTEIMPVSQKALFDTITDYEKYPEFLSEIKSIRILESSKNKKIVEYETVVIKTFKYVLELSENPRSDVSWRMVSGDLFKSNDGGWTLTAIGPQETEVTYRLDVDFGFFVPKMVTNALTNTNLPDMMKKFLDRTKALHVG